MGSAVVEQLIHPSRPSWLGFPVAVGQRVYPVFGYPALGVQERQRNLVKALPVDVVAILPQDIHAVPEGLLLEEGLSVLRVPDVLLHNDLCHAVGPVDILASHVEDGEHLSPQAHVHGNHFLVHVLRLDLGFRCRGAASGPRTTSKAGFSRNRTRGASRVQGRLFPLTPGGLAQGDPCKTGRRPCCCRICSPGRRLRWK